MRYQLGILFPIIYVLLKCHRIWWTDLSGWDPVEIYGASVGLEVKGDDVTILEPPNRIELLTGLKSQIITRPSILYNAPAEITVLGPPPKLLTPDKP